MTPPLPLRMVVLAGALASVTLCPARAHATGSLSEGAHQPLEQRIVLSIGPTRTSLWTQLRARTTAGSFAIVVPAEPLAALDWSTPAWTEALEVATAPRILPPAGEEAICPGDPAASPIDIAGDPYHHNPATPVEVIVLDDALAVDAWAAQVGLVVSAATLSALAALPNHRFVAARFDAHDGELLTPTLRVVGPGVAPVAPLVLSEAGDDDDLLVTLWTIGEGRATVSGGELAPLDLSNLRFDAASAESNYAELRSQALLANPASSLLETTSTQALVGGFDAAISEHAIKDVVSTYFQRAAVYMNGAIDGLQCVDDATNALSTDATFAESCPRAALDVVDGSASCIEAPTSSELDPELVRCGGLVDDLAVALSGQRALDVTLTRHALMVPATQRGSTRTISLAPGAEVTPWLEASEVDLSGCDGSGGSSSSPSTSGSGAANVSSGSGGRKTVQVPVYQVDTSCGAREVGDVLYFLTVEVDETEDYPDYYTSEDDCGGDTSGSVTPVYDDSDSTYDVGDGSYASDEVSDEYNGDCSGDTSDTSSDSCSGDSSDTSSDSCGGDSSGSSGDSCGGDSGSGEGCSIGLAKRRRPRLSVLVMGLLMLLTPLRRVTRRKRIR